MLICMACGAWAETGASAALRQWCRRAPGDGSDKPSPQVLSKHAADAIARVRKGSFPKPGKAAKGGIVVNLSPLAEIVFADT